MTARRKHLRPLAKVPALGQLTLADKLELYDDLLEVTIPLFRFKDPRNPTNPPGTPVEF